MTSVTTTTEDNGMNSPLPEELVEKILLRTPAKSLVRFKLVCKSWRSLITDRSFAKKHVRANIINNNNKTLFLLWNKEENESSIIKQGISVIEANDGGLSCVVGQPNLPRSVTAELEDRFYQSTFLAAFHCNGVICVSESYRGLNSKIVFINPALKQLKRFTRPYPHPSQHYFVGEAFGYDSGAEDFKFVVVWRARDRLENTARVYSLRTDSWKEIGVDGNLDLCFFSNEAEVYAGGVYYWRNNADMVVAFDFSEERFHLTPLPDRVERDVPMCWKRFALWRDSVVVFNVIENYLESTVFEMWAMGDKFGGSWTKHLTIGPLPNIRNPLWFWNDDELLMGTMEREIVSYNLRTKKLRTLPTGDSIPRASYHFEYYTESLVSVIKRV